MDIETVVEQAVADTASESAGTAETKTETATQPSFRDVEKSYNESMDKRFGRDMSKYVDYSKPPSERGKPEKADDKPATDTKAADTKTADGKSDKAAEGSDKKDDAADKKAEGTGEDATKADQRPSSIRKLKNRLTAVREENIRLNERLKALETRTTQATTQTQTEDKKAELKEPNRSDYASFDEYFAALRAFDKQTRDAEKSAITQQAESDAFDIQLKELTKVYTSKLEDVKEKYEDFDELTSDPTIRVGRAGDEDHLVAVHGVILNAGPELTYQLAKNRSYRRAIESIDADSLLAVTSTSDDVLAVMLHLVKTPEDVSKLNSFSGPKQAKFIGEIETKIAVEKKATEKKADTPAAKSEDRKEVKATPAATPPSAPKPKSDVAPKVSGTSVQSDDWRDSESMSFRDRERLYMKATRR